MIKHSSLADSFRQLHPTTFLLDKNDPAGLTEHLKSIRFLQSDEQITRLEKTGNGTMNLVLRAFTPYRTFIVKQARPWMETNPVIGVPTERIMEEALYYRLLSDHYILRKYHPAFLGFEESSNLLMLEDLGNVSDYTHLYQKGNELDPYDARSLVKYLVLLHTNFRSDRIYEHIFNRDMRKMNFENIFINPFRHNSELDLDNIQPGFRELARPFLTDKMLIDEVKYMGRLYESDGNYLVHGDFYPGSWLKSDSGIKVIDPEFCFFGPSEFDIGVFWAHMVITRQPKTILQEVTMAYSDQSDFDGKMAIRFAGVEIFRRLFGENQMPVYLTLRERKDLMDQARKMLLHCEESVFWPLIHPA